MNRRLNRDIRAWLEAERASDEWADEALRRAFGRLRRRAPGPGLADRVLLRAGYPVGAAAAWRSRWLRGAVAACILVAGLAIITLPAWWLVASPVVQAFGSPLLLALSRATVRWMSAAFASWAAVQDVASALRTALVTRTAMALLTANALLAVLSLSGLKRLLKAPGELTS